MFKDDESSARLNKALLNEESDLAQINAQKAGLPFIDLSIYPIEPDALREIPEETAKENSAIAFKKDGNTLHIAVADSSKIDSLKSFLNETVNFYITTETNIEKALSRYNDLKMSVSTTKGTLDISAENISELAAQLDSIADFDANISTGESSTSSLIEYIFAGALSMSASDIHLEPEQKSATIRFRIDGVLRDASKIEIEKFNGLASRLKLLAGVKLNRKEPQDGRFSILFSGRQIEIRASFIPEAEGESIVMRILDPEKTTVNISSLGIRTDLKDKILSELSRPNGMILTTGPTGSGKTTTLYSLLEEKNSPEIKILTIEDPVEYKIPGIVQTQVNESLSFADGLRSAMRQDPDVIMIGEIRDGEVAETALHAALTGHLVLATLHTNSAAGTFPRLVDLGIDPKTFESSINVAMAQRLVRRIKEGAGRKVPLEGELRAKIEKIVSDMNPAYAPKEIPEFILEADEDDYSGRIGVFEIIFMDDNLAQLLREKPGESEIEKYARENQGMVSMLEDGILKVLEGTTTIAEIQRVVGNV